MPKASISTPDRRVYMRSVHFHSGNLLCPARPWDRGRFAMMWINRKTAESVRPTGVPYADTLEEFDYRLQAHKLLHFQTKGLPGIASLDLWFDGSSLIVCEGQKQMPWWKTLFTRAPGTGAFRKAGQPAAEGASRSNLYLVDEITMAEMVAEGLYYLDGAHEVYDQLPAGSARDRALILEIAANEAKSVGRRADTGRIKLPKGSYQVYRHSSPALLQKIAIENGFSLGSLLPIAIVTPKILRFKGKVISPLDDLASDQIAAE